MGCSVKGRVEYLLGISDAVRARLRLMRTQAFANPAADVSLHADINICEQKASEILR